MKVFISWSGETSQKVATVFREWLPSVIQSIEPYVSSEDIDKGARWSTDIAKELADSTFGILCVTKENLEAPWLSFEAGALSKTMEKSFVTPFLFDIKRSEVQGPILQFQSTIFKKDDIKKMIKTLNSASGDKKIADERLEKAFDVWYPTLEKELNNIKSDSKDKENGKKPNQSNDAPEILEEILELSRDNQKLLRNPNPVITEDMAYVKQSIDQLLSKSSMAIDKKRATRKYNSMLLDEIMHMSGNRYSYGLLMTLSLIKEDFPWIYDMGKEFINTLKSDVSKEEKYDTTEDFKRMVEFTFGHPAMRDIIMRNNDIYYYNKDYPYIVFRYIDEIAEQYIV